ncbi:trimeric intracellular cation channel family protein [Berryella intestinalis]|nr:TRIC cation channel family protein [Berryella intestinalis]
MLLSSMAAPSMEFVALSLDFLAVVIGSLGGSLFAVDRKLDLIGAMALALLCGLGGGLLRDMIMQVGDVYILRTGYAIPASAVTAAVVFFLSSPFQKRPRLIEWIDIFSVALYVAAGSGKAIAYGLDPWAVILLGMLTGVGGGMLRDVFLGEVPRIFQKSNFYAVCAILGAIAYLASSSLGFVGFWPALICTIVTVASRRLSLRYDIKSPSQSDLHSFFGGRRDK